MADNVLEIIIKADVDKAQSNIANFSKQLPKIGEAANVANKGLQNVTKNSQSASFAVLNLGRIAQDSAFGFIGIANNIEPFIQSVTALRASATQGASATKQFFGALAGPAGIGLLIGAVQIFDAYQNGYGIFANKANEARKAQKSFTDEIDKAKAPTIAAGLQLQAFVDIAANSALPLAQRNEALARGNKILGDYGEKLTLANVATKAITDQTKLFTDALVSQIIAEKNADRIATLKIKAFDDLRLAQNNLQKATKDYTTAVTTSTIKEAEMGRNVMFLNIKTNAQKSLTAAQAKYEADQLNIIKETTDLNKLTAESVGLFTKLGTTEKVVAEVKKTSTAAIKAQSTALEDAAKAAADFQREFNGIIAPIQKLTETLGNRTQSVTSKLILANQDLKDLLLLNLTTEQRTLAIQQQKLVIAERAKIAANIAGMPTTAGANLLVQKEPVTLATDVASDEKKLANLTAIQQKTDEIKTAFSLLGPIIDASFNALAGGENAVEGLKAAIKSLIIQLLKAAALAAIIAIATGGSGDPVSFLSAFKSILGLPGKAQGGTVNSGSPYIVGENGPELFVPTGSGNIVSNGRFGNMGGGGGILSARVSGGDLLFILNQAGNNRSVNFG